jgi:DNA-binding NarL/FixJ family response regulator
MTTATEPQRSETGFKDTGPQQVLDLTRQGMSYRDVAELLHMSPATVARRVQQAREANRDRTRAVLMNVLVTYLTVLATIATAALAGIAWG